MAELGSRETSEQDLGILEPERAPSPTAKQEQEQPRRRHSRPDWEHSFATYFPRVLKKLHEGLSLSQEAKSLMDSFVSDVFEHLAAEAARLAWENKCLTLTLRDMQNAAHRPLPGKPHKYANIQGIRALRKFAIGQ